MVFRRNRWIFFYLKFQTFLFVKGVFICSRIVSDALASIDTHACHAAHPFNPFRLSALINNPLL